MRRYLDDPPTRAELEGVLARLGLEPWDLARPEGVRRGGPDVPARCRPPREWLDGLAAHPRAIQRPIITAADGTTVIGRDPDSIATAIRHEAG